jgi:hypothetical protein
MNIIEKWLLLNKPERYYHKLSFKYNNTIEKINSLNKKRQALQKRIVNLSQASNICFDCQGVCCRGNYNHFTVIDYLIRLYSDNPIKSFDKIRASPTFINLVINRLRYIITGKSGTETMAKLTTRCPDLGDGTCNILPEDRPIRCVLWTCTEFKKNFDQKKLREIGHLNKELQRVIRQVIKTYKGEK